MKTTIYLVLVSLPVVLSMIMGVCDVVSYFKYPRANRIIWIIIAALCVATFPPLWTL